MRLDFSNVKDTTAGPVPAGRYTVVCTNGEEDVVKEGSRNEGAPLFKWEFTISDEDNDYNNRKVWDNMVVVPPDADGKGGTYWRVKQLLRACGLDVDGELEFDTDDVEGCELEIDVEERPARTDEDTGKEYKASNRVKRFYPKKSDAPQQAKSNGKKSTAPSLR